MQIGLKPNEVLDMSLDMFQACTQGYSDRLLDNQILGVQQGYWAGYYSRAKKPKALGTIINKLLKTHNAEKSKARQVVPEIDVDAFLKKEQDFKKRLAETKK